jgi:hypothetical protein
VIQISGSAQRDHLGDIPGPFMFACVSMLGFIIGSVAETHTGLPSLEWSATGSSRDLTEYLET